MAQNESLEGWQHVSSWFTKFHVVSVFMASLVSGETALGKEPSPEDENHEDDLLEDAGPLLRLHRNLKFTSA